MTNDYATAFAHALAREINAELGRQGIHGFRAAARLFGTTNHTSVTNKLSPETGKFVVMTITDLAEFCMALRVEPADIVRRAQALADWEALAEAEAFTARVRELSGEDPEAEEATPSTRDIS